MKTSALLSAWTLLLASASASHFTLSNGTHFVDPQTKHTMRHFGCDVHKGHASEHFLKTIKKMHNKHKYSNVGTRAARPMAKINLHKPPPPPKPKKPTSSSTTTSKSSSTSTPTQSPSSSGMTIPTYFHIIQSNAKKNLVTQTMVTAQLNAMKKAYNPYGIDFNLVNTDFTTNDAWAVGEGGTMDAAKSALRKGTYGTLNVYFHTDLSGGNLGTCTLPANVPGGAAPSLYASDGCNVNANSMPGGQMYGYNQGYTAVHEVGHWLGLLHTFEGYSCDGDGDMIVDTRVEAQSTNGCPTSPAKNSCPSQPGVDPIHNFMDYSTDACYESFTDGQVARMQSLWTQYRKGK